MAAAAETGIYTPREAEVVEAVTETAGIVTLRLRLSDPAAHRGFRFAPGQFNMLHLHGVGEVPISISSDPDDVTTIDHTIRAVGRVTNAMVELRAGERLGLRGPYGRGWPLREAEGRELLIITGGLGCAPAVSVINYVFRRRERFGRLTIVQGVKRSQDLIWRDQYAAWEKEPNTLVLLAADVAERGWPGVEGPVTVLFNRFRIDPRNTIAMMCGPERMMQAAAGMLQVRNVPRTATYLSMERSMHCGFGHCGHCQMGPLYTCRDGPVFRFDEVAPWLDRPGF